MPTPNLKLINRDDVVPVCRKGGCANAAPGDLGICSACTSSAELDETTFAYMRSLMIAQLVKNQLERLDNEVDELSLVGIEMLAAQRVDARLQRTFEGRRKVFAA